jgi:hypothetical protein
MLDRSTISRAADEPGRDPRRLLELGLETIRRLAGGVWTDHNAHDPGITTLEVLCYALTDLTYRASFPIEDLVATAAPGGAAPFATARELLPASPLTARDYRKLLTDLPGVKNAWIEPVTRTYFVDPVARKLVRADPNLPGIRCVNVRGLYRALLELTDEGQTEGARDEVVARAHAVLRARRNLCEDFVEVRRVDREEFRVCGELELDPGADTAEVTAEILFRIEQYLAPPVRSYTLDEMLARRHADGTPYAVHEIFGGPPLSCGFIDDVELDAAALRTEIRLSDVIHLAMQVEGVRAVRDMIVNRADVDEPVVDRWRIPVSSGKQAGLRRSGCRLVVTKRGMPVPPDPRAVEARYAERVAADRRKLEEPPPRPFDLPVPAGRPRNPGAYHSIMNHFPAIYGVGDQGVPAGADDRRRALALQLEGYLLLFDQVLADFCAQLAHVDLLFSTDAKIERTYFHQLVTSFRDAAKIYGATQLGGLETLDDADEGIDRRSRFLDHLLARFAERFQEYAGVVRSAFGATPRDLVDQKCRFLQNGPAVARDRGLGYDLTTLPEDRWNSQAVSGLEKRVASLLGMATPVRRNLADVAHEIYPELDDTPGDEFRFRVRHAVTGRILLSSSTRYATQAAALAEMNRALTFARRRSGYQRKVTASGKHYFNVVDDGGEVLARRIEYFDDEAGLSKAIDELIAYLEAYYGEEGMYVIENVLLLPERDADDALLPICVDLGCADGPDDDPYSYRIHVVLPADAGRFTNVDFRAFVEEVVREECPAHVLPKVCWAGREDMAKLEAAYRTWITLPAEAATPRREAALAALTQALYAVKSVHPAVELTPCPSAKEKFILGRSALGSAKEDA